MKVIKGFDPESNQMIIKITSNLVKEYSKNFSEIVKKEFKKPDVGISFESEDTVSVIGLKMDDFSKFEEVLNRFTNESLGHKIKNTEFIPLEGYSIDKLSSEIVDAVKNKRNLCIIRDYKEYEECSVDKSYTYTQKEIFFGTLEYAKAVIMIYKKDIESLRKRYKSALVKKEWC